MKSLAKITLLILGAVGSYSAHSAPLNRMVANWHIDEGRGQKILDSSGYGRNGLLGSGTGIEVTDPLWVSRRFDNAALSNLNNGNYVGEIDEVRIWNKALTATEVAKRYQGY